jgi:hypothetical protein
VQAHRQYLYSPVFTQTLQPLGTVGKEGDWDGNPLWPGIVTYRDIIRPHRAAGESLNFTVLEEWWLNRFAAWKAEPAKPITLEEVSAVLEDTPGLWIKPAAGDQRRQAGRGRKDKKRNRLPGQSELPIDSVW